MVFVENVSSKKKPIKVSEYCCIYLEGFRDQKNKQTTTTTATKTFCSTLKKTKQPNQKHKTFQQHLKKKKKKKKKNTQRPLCLPETKINKFQNGGFVLKNVVVLFYRSHINCMRTI